MEQENCRTALFLTFIALSSLLILSNPALFTRVVAGSATTGTLHNAIGIHSNEDFTAANGVVSGSGTATDPFIMENWIINVQTSSVPVVFPSGTLIAGILIANTTAYVILRNVEVYSLIPEWFMNLNIVLSNTTNVSVESSRVWAGSTGVALLGARDSRVVSNEFFYLTQPVAIAGGLPVPTSIASGNSVSQNWIHDSRDTGVVLVAATDNLISDNWISNMEAWGGFIDRGSANNVFSGNHVSNSAVGIEAVDSSLNNTISQNSFNVTILGVGVGFGANGTIVSDNEIHSLKWGVNLIDVSGTRVSQNTVQASAIGINLLEATVGDTITGNVVTSHIGLFICGTEIGFNHIAPPPNDLRASDRPIERCG